MSKKDTNGGPDHLLDSLRAVLAQTSLAETRKGPGRAPTRRGKGKDELPLTISRPELLVEGSDSLYRQLVHNLLSFLATHEAIRDGLASCIGLGGIQHTILQSIRHLGRSREVSVRDVADHLDLSGSFITAETAKMERAGLLTKSRSATDGRKVSLELTEKAMDLFDAVAPFAAGNRRCRVWRAYPQAVSGPGADGEPAGPHQPGSAHAAALPEEQ